MPILTDDKIINLNGFEYACVKLPGPSDQVHVTEDAQKQEWDYIKDPIGPKSLGWGKTEYEIESLRDRWMLIPSHYFRDYISGSFVVKNVYVVTNSGVWKCDELNCSDIHTVNSPPLKNKTDLNRETIINLIENSTENMTKYASKTD